MICSYVKSALSGQDKWPTVCRLPVRLYRTLPIICVLYPAFLSLAWPLHGGHGHLAANNFDNSNARAMIDASTSVRTLYQMYRYHRHIARDAGTGQEASDVDLVDMVR